MNANRILRMALSAALAVAAASTRAEPEGGAGAAYPKAQYPYGELVRQPLTLSAGLIQVDVPVEVNLSKDLVGKPWNVPLAADYGYTDALQLGIFHQTGLCLASEKNGCAKPYDDFGVRFRYGPFRDPDGQLALQGGVMASSFERSLFDGYVGAAYKRTMGRIALVLEGNVTFALDDREVLREPRLTVRGVQHREAFLSHADLQVELLRGLAAFGRVGYAVSLEDPPAARLPWLVPVGLGAEYQLFPRFAVGAELTFENLLGEDSTADERTGAAFARLFL